MSESGTPDDRETFTRTADRDGGAVRAVAIVASHAVEVIVAVRACGSFDVSQARKSALNIHRALTPVLARDRDDKVG